MVRRLLLIIAAVGLFALETMAQSSMTDRQIIEFVQRENAAGTSRQQIVTKLMQRGVSVDQLRRIEKKYKNAGSSTLGAQGSTSSVQGSDRLRSANGDTIRSNSLGYQRGYDYEPEDLTPAERQRLQSERENDYYESLDFLYPDSLNRQDTKRVFGRDIFNNSKLTFESSMNIATPADYVLGPGDVVFVDVWGASQKAVQSTVSPEGTIDIEGYGPVSVSGLTVRAANAKLRSTLGERYRESSMRLSVGQTRTITVQVMGDVNVPGSYTLSAFATVFHALYMAGGINDIGTLRDIKVYRAGRLISSVDIYEYILHGKLAGNVRLADDDVVLVGSYKNIVDITGKVKRPMYYEMKDGESLGTLIDYAGGFTGDAYRKNVRLVRKNGVEYSVYTVEEFDQGGFKLMDGDSVSVDSVLARYSNMVEVKGAVFRPGMYQVDGSVSTVRDLLEKAGLREDAILARGVMHRLKADRTLEVLALNIGSIVDHTMPDVALRNGDVLYVPSNQDITNARYLKISGEVQYPGEYVYADNTTIEDLIMQAGGMKDAASTAKVDVSRRIRNNNSLTSGSVIAESYTLSIRDGFVVEGTPGFVLMPYDEVYVRRSPGYVEQQMVSVEGEVAFVGDYPLVRKGQRLSDLVRIAGGLTAEAYSKGARLERRLTMAEKLRQQSMIKLATNDSIDLSRVELGDTRFVGINLDKAVANPGNDEWDIIIEEGDRLIVPQMSNTVSINGEVMYPNTVAFKKGEGLDYYINQSGGFTTNARSRKVFAVHMNGTVTRVKSSKDLSPGCEIVVPAKPNKRGMSLAEIVGLGSITASLITAIAVLAK